MTCPRPRPTRTGELECPACGLSWGVDDHAPDCPAPPMPAHHSPVKHSTTRVRTREIGQRAIENIRNILRKGS